MAANARSGSTDPYQSHSCPFCSSAESTIDFLSVGNLYRLPATLAVSVFVGPVIRIWVKCKNCRRRYLARDAA